MCGIVGMVSTKSSGFDFTQKEVFSELLFADTLRGADSTGAFTVNNLGNVSYLKDAVAGPALLKTSEFTTFLAEMYSRGRIVVGHNRKATRGIVTDENAHPFVENDTILVHNGTIRDHEKLTTEKVSVDSHAILHSINEQGWRNTMKQIDGAYSLAWYSAEEKKLFLTRNGERPLWLANAFGCWYFASEREMLEWILKRNNVEYKEITELKAHHVYEFDLTKLDQKILIRPYTSKMEADKLQQEKMKGVAEEKSSVIPFRKRVLPSLLEQKSEKTNSKTTKKGGEKEQEVTKFSPSIFRVGSRVSVEITGDPVYFKLSDSDAGYRGYVIGKLLEQDESLLVRVFFRKVDEPFIEKISKHKDIISAEIYEVMHKHGEIKAIHTHKPIDFYSSNSRNGEEVYPDDYLFYSMSCKECKKPVTWSMIPKSFVKIERPERLTCTCPDCIERLK